MYTVWLKKRKMLAKLECGPMPNVVAALPNIGGALCSTPQSLLECRAVTLPRGETSWNLLGCPKLANGSQPFVGRNSPYCADMYGKYWCLTSFFPIVDMCFSCEDIARQSCAMDGDFLRPVFPASGVQQISGMHSKFAVRPHRVSKYGRHTICDGWDKARNKKDRKKRQGKNIMSASATQDGHKYRTTPAVAANSSLRESKRRVTATTFSVHTNDHSPSWNRSTPR